MSNHHPIVAALLLMALLATACSSSAASTLDQSGDEITPLTEQMLKNGTYEGIYQEAIQLTDGLFEGQPFVDGGASRPTVTFTGVYVWGDLNSDGVDDAVVVLVESSGGSGSFFYLAAVLNRNGNPENVATYLLGDRAQVQSITAAEGNIEIHTVAHGPDDPMCCPTQKAILNFRLDGEHLIKLSEETSGPVTTPDDANANSGSGDITPDIIDTSDIVDIVWHWQRFDDTAGLKDIVVDDPVKYTLTLLPDGTYQIKADCNLASGAYTLQGSNLTLHPGPMTLAECGPGSLYNEYLSWLGQVATLVLEDGKLVLNLKADAGNMIFVQTEDVASTTPDIVDVEWRWTELVETMPAAQSIVPDPEHYTLVFKSDGSLHIKADCNVVGGSYDLQGDALTIKLGPATMAFCGEQSLDQQYLALLSNVGGYALQNGRLVLYLEDDAGKMTFDRVKETTVPPVDETASTVDITSVLWKWEQMTTPPEVTTVDDPTKYTIELQPDGQFLFAADCNIGSGTYTLDGAHISFQLGRMTRAACPSESLSDQFINGLSAAAIYFVEGDNLFIDLKFDSGTLKLIR
jgi:heat shock protein HslJ/major membrane immunogen (membrane-anchored lipoprotein)